jgi:hypothetical protein
MVLPVLSSFKTISRTSHFSMGKLFDPAKVERLLSQRYSTDIHRIKLLDK